MTGRAPRTYGVGLLAALMATALWGFTFLGPAAVAPVNVYYLVVGRYAVFGAMSLAVLAARRGGLRRLGTRNLLLALHLGSSGTSASTCCFPWPPRPVAECSPPP
ncbi:hypothetical protein [Streptomyces sp. NPDC008001]|uniref:hypothetical protein n=1 Tax=Streptomyces sp. NPDC008001 TaxID=3364804 RepID=UPI0036EDA9FD